MERPSCLASPIDQIPAYYMDMGDEAIQASFINFDDSDNFERSDRHIRDPAAKNFCIDFGDDDAWAAFDLEPGSYSKLTSTPRPPNLHTRWINIWLPSAQKGTLHVLAKQFDFSPRLLGLMCSEPLPPNPESVDMKKSTSTLRSRMSGRSHRSSKKSSQGEKEMDMDSEESIGMTEMMHSTQLEMLKDLNHYHMVDEVWHWSTVDWGRRFVCLGYNTLHNVRANNTADCLDENTDGRQNIPHGKRVWNWLLLCEDKTVISISEDPFPFSDSNSLRPNELRTLSTIRRNLVSVFRQLTKAPTLLRETTVILLPIRHRIGNSNEETAHRPTDAPGLLFYYLFEDWFTTYCLITRRDNGYAAELDRLRREMLVQANLSHVDQLHHIGLQLSVLKRVYQSYSLIIERVLKKQEATLASLKNSHIVSGPDSLASSLPNPSSPTQLQVFPMQIQEADSLLGVGLSSAARVRFERLQDRICLYALSEIQECIDQKESLVMMNFNLIAIKESFSVERLTRITLLLAKITIVFMPVTLMTGYFSIQFLGVSFEVKNYWWAFAVVLGVSMVMLFMLSFFSGTMEAKMMKKPLKRLMGDARKRWFERGRGGAEKGE